MTLAKPLGVLTVSLCVGLASPSTAARGPSARCEQAIERAAGAYLARHAGVVKRCDRLRVQGILAADVDCLTDAETAAELEGVRRDLEDAIDRACGGADRRCGTGDDPTLAEIGWGEVSQCPDLDRSGCTNAITSCADITACIQCAGDAASAQLSDVTTGDFEADEFGTRSDANFCQLAIVKASTKLLQTRARALGKCWVARMRGKGIGDCPEGKGKHVKAIARAEAKKDKAICKACGGDDGRCGGADDVPLADVGFADACPDLSVPSGGSCGGAILDVPDAVDCVDCVARFKAECLARLAAPRSGPYPPECNPGSGLCGNGTVDPGEACDPGSPGGAFACAPGTTCTAQCECGATTTTTTTLGGLCGNGVADPGEQCDPGGGSPIGAFGGSPNGSFGCDPGQTCTVQCTCEGATSTTIATTTTTTTLPAPVCKNGILDPGEECDASSPTGAFACPSGFKCHPKRCFCEAKNGTTTTTTTLPKKCGNGVVDSKEECDGSSPSGSFLCGPGEQCHPKDCECVPGSTTTTLPSGCGNGVVDPGEACDPSSPSGSFLCPVGTTCTAGCVCAGASTTSTTLGVTTTTLGGTTSTTSTPGTTIPATTTTVPTGPPAFLDFTTRLSDEICGTTYDAVAQIEDNELDDLSCGGLNIGGGLSSVLEGPTPDGSTSRFALSCNGNACTLGPTSTAGPGFQCTNTGCRFGTPLPIPNAGLSTCVTNTFAAPASGTANLANGNISANVSLSSQVILTGNANQPCPICRSGSITGPPCAGTPESPCTGVCQGSPNQASACTSTNSDGLSVDCPAPAATAGSNRCFGGSNNGQVCTTSGQCGGGTCAQLIGAIPVNLSPLTTGTSSLSSPGGTFCPNQSAPGCFGDEDCRAIRERGAPAGSLLPVGTSRPVTLASVFCIPTSGAPLIDSSASLPGPGATALPGTVRLVP